MKKKKKRDKRSQESQEQTDALPGTFSSDDRQGDALLRDAVSLVGGKWKFRVLWALQSGDSIRYGEIRSRISGITDMMLSQSLKELAADGLVERRQYREIPPRVEYEVTAAGAGLIPVLEQLCVWVKGQEKHG
ncbi:MAG: helix-turn-helix transcriptional regulator [Oscillospiraceae bacterium]|nr:helix-turn-helix transcriptional regulator [Oscillospiraceae bacterium]